MKLDERLLAVACCVPDGAYLADVGTDHAYLPVYLAAKGRLSGAVASDIHKAPLESANKNIGEAGFSGLIHTVLTDGLQGLAGYPITDIAIAVGFDDASYFARVFKKQTGLTPREYKKRKE